MVLFSGGGDSKVSFTQKKEVQYIVSALTCVFILPIWNWKVPLSQGGWQCMDRQRQYPQVLGKLTITCQLYLKLVLLLHSPSFFHFLQVQTKVSEQLSQNIKLLGEDNLNEFFNTIPNARAYWTWCIGSANIFSHSGLK